MTVRLNRANSTANHEEEFYNFIDSNPLCNKELIGKKCHGEEDSEKPKICVLAKTTQILTSNVTDNIPI